MSSVAALASYLLLWAGLPLIFLGLFEVFRAFYLRSIERAIYPSSQEAVVREVETGSQAEVSPLRLDWTDAARVALEEARPELAKARRDSRRTRVAFAVAGSVYTVVAAIMVLYGSLNEGQRWASAVGYAYLATGPALVIILGFMRAHWSVNVTMLAGWLGLEFLVLVMTGATWTRALGGVFVTSVPVLAPPLLAVGLLMLRRLRPLLVAFVPTFLFLLTGTAAVVLGADAILPGGFDGAMAAQAAFPGWMRTLSWVPTIVGAAIAVREIRRGLRWRLFVALAALLAIGLLAASRAAAWFLLGAFCLGTALNALAVLATWGLFKAFAHVKRRGGIPDELLHIGFCWFVLIWFIAILAGEERPYLGWSLLPFVASMVTLVLILMRQRQRRRGERPRRMLLLRVFGKQRPTNRLLDTLDDTWRCVGRVDAIAGLDLAMRTLGAFALSNAFLGRVHQHFLRTAMEMEERLRLMSTALMLGGRYPLNELYCAPQMWRVAVERLVDGADVVLMDLRGFQAINTGASYELSLLVRRVSLSRIVVLTDRHTDERTLSAVVHDAWQHLPAGSPNLGSRDAHLSILRCSNSVAVNAQAIERAVFSAAFEDQRVPGGEEQR